MKKGGGSASTIIIGPSKSVLVYSLHSLEYFLGLARFRVFVAKLYYIKALIYHRLFLPGTIIKTGQHNATNTIFGYVFILYLKLVIYKEK